jgi:transcriptional regulator with GAF, ATPase, and Fis domain
MSFIEPEESNADVVLMLKIEELRDMARQVLDDVDDIRAGAICDVKNGIDIFEEVRRFEVKLIRQALLAAHGQQLRASRLLGLKATTLNAKIKRYEIRV